MRIAVVGGDRRFDLLAGILAKEYDVQRNPASLAEMDWVVAKDAVRISPDSRWIVMGGSAEGAVDLMKDEDFVRKNAILTAEGAVSAAMRATERAFLGSRCLVVGYGRIAQALARMLAAMGAHVTVAARREEVRDRIRADGYAACGITAEELSLEAARADFIFSTPPAMVFTEGVLTAVRPGVPVIDLASPPFGVDLEAAQRLGVSAWRESGLPGRYCPMTAAELMAEAIKKVILR